MNTNPTRRSSFAPDRRRFDYSSKRHPLSKENATSGRYCYGKRMICLVLSILCFTQISQVGATGQPATGLHQPKKRGRFIVHAPVPPSPQSKANANGSSTLDGQSSRHTPPQPEYKTNTSAPQVSTYTASNNTVENNSNAKTKYLERRGRFKILEETSKGPPTGSKKSSLPNASSKTNTNGALSLEGPSSRANTKRLLRPPQPVLEINVSKEYIDKAGRFKILKDTSRDPPLVSQRTIAPSITNLEVEAKKNSSMSNASSKTTNVRSTSGVLSVSSSPKTKTKVESESSRPIHTHKATNVSNDASSLEGPVTDVSPANGSSQPGPDGTAECKEIEQTTLSVHTSTLETHPEESRVSGNNDQPRKNGRFAVGVSVRKSHREWADTLKAGDSIKFKMREDDTIWVHAVVLKVRQSESADGLSVETKIMYAKLYYIPKQNQMTDAARQKKDVKISLGDESLKNLHPSYDCRGTICSAQSGTRCQAYSKFDIVRVFCKTEQRWVQRKVADVIYDGEDPMVEFAKCCSDCRKQKYPTGFEKDRNQLTSCDMVRMDTIHPDGDCGRCDDLECFRSTDNGNGKCKCGRTWHKGTICDDGQCSAICNDDWISVYSASQNRLVTAKATTQGGVDNLNIITAHYFISKGSDVFNVKKNVRLKANELCACWDKCLCKDCEGTGRKDRKKGQRRPCTVEAIQCRLCRGTGQVGCEACVLGKIKPSPNEKKIFVRPDHSKRNKTVSFTYSLWSDENTRCSTCSQIIDVYCQTCGGSGNRPCTEDKCRSCRGTQITQACPHCGENGKDWIDYGISFDYRRGIIKKPGTLLRSHGIEEGWIISKVNGVLATREDLVNYIKPAAGDRRLKTMLEEAAKGESYTVTFRHMTLMEMVMEADEEATAKRRRLAEVEAMHKAHRQALRVCRGR